MLSERKGEHAKEIMNALKVQGYGKKGEEVQSILDKDRSEQTVLKLKTEHSIPQESLMGKSGILTKNSDQKKVKKHTAKLDANKVQQERDKSQKKKPLEKNNKLVDLISKNKVERLKKIDISQYDKQEILNLALKYSSWQIVNYLIKDKNCTIKGSDLDTSISSLKGTGYTLLHLAAREDLCDLIELLLDNEKFDVNVRGKEDLTPLHCAVAKGRRSAVELFFKNKEIDVNARNKNGITPLYLAMIQGSKCMIELLLKNEKVDVNAKSDEGHTSLHLAVQENRKDVVELLLKNEEVDIDARNSLDFAPLHLAAQIGHTNVVKLFLQHGADVNAKSIQNCTPLYLAVQGNHTSVVKLLLQHGADVNVRSTEGYALLHLAAQDGYADTAQLLIDHGANINAKNGKGGVTPLHLAAEHGHISVVELLLDKRADVGTESDTNSTPLHFAAGKGHKYIVELLLGNKADISAKDIDSFTPLHLAAQNDHASVVKLLLQHGADVNAENIQNSTPLHLVVQGGHTSVVKLLLQHGADVNAKANKLTPLLIALERGYSEIVDLLLADPNVNVGCIPNAPSISKNRENLKRFLQKLTQDRDLFNMVKQAENKADENKLKEIGELLKSEKYKFKLGLNYSPDGNDENTTIKIAIKAGGKLLDLLYDYAEKNIGRNTEIFKQLKRAKENSQSSSDLDDVSVSNHFTQTQTAQF